MFGVVDVYGMIHDVSESKADAQDRADFWWEPVTVERVAARYYVVRVDGWGGTEAIKRFRSEAKAQLFQADCITADPNGGRYDIETVWVKADLRDRLGL